MSGHSQLVNWPLKPGNEWKFRDLLDRCPRPAGVPRSLGFCLSASDKCNHSHVYLSETERSDRTFSTCQNVSLWADSGTVDSCTSFCWVLLRSHWSNTGEPLQHLCYGRCRARTGNTRVQRESLITLQAYKSVVHLHLLLSRCGVAVRCQAGKQKDLGSIRFGSPFSWKIVVYGHWLMTLPTHLMKH